MKRWLLAGVVALLATAASAHEYWLLPNRFTAAPGERVGIEHRVGTGWPGEPVPRVPQRIVRFALVDTRGERPIEGEPGADPAGTVALRLPGIAFAVYRSRATSIRLEPALFESYLRDEGLERIAAIRAERGESAQPGLEMFSRNAKSLIVASGAAAKTGSRAALTARDAQLWRRPLGLTLEIVPETDPRHLGVGTPFALRVLFHGQPLAGVLVKAFPKDANERKRLARTDDHGRVSFDLAEPGVWLINTVHMIDAPPHSGSRWESLWSSLTFELGAARR